MTVSSKLRKGLSGGDAANVEDVFSTYLYEGNNGHNAITNGIDLDGEGGMVWFKERSRTDNHYIFDTERGNSVLKPNLTNAATATSYLNDLKSFNPNGFTLGQSWSTTVNNNGVDVASWTFRKAPRFFDVVTYSGQATDLTVQHSLGVIPGMIIVKDLTVAGDWKVYHISLGEYKEVALNKTDTSGTTFGWNGYVPTDVDFQVNGEQSGWCQAGHEYVAYLFAHDPDGEDDDGMIACGNMTGDGSTQEVDLGWEAQYVLSKNSSSGGNWELMDTMRGAAHVSDGTAMLYANLSSAETESGGAVPTANGFKLWGASNKTYIYMAIRAPMMVEPEAGTEVFAVDTSGSTGDGKAPAYRSGFPVDASLHSNITGGAGFTLFSRLTQGKQMYTASTDAENNNPTASFDNNIGFYNSTSVDTDIYAWMFKRAKGFFDVVAYTGNSTNDHNVNHSLGVVPQLMIVKQRNGSNNWGVYNETSGATKAMALESAGGTYTHNIWYDTPPTDTVFTLGSSVEVNGVYPYIAYLFATLDSVSKVGSYTGNGSNQNIDCGFSAGARFVLIKRTDASGDFYIWDTTRGIVSGNDPHLSLNTAVAEVTTDDSIDPQSSGFTVNQVSATNINVSSATYIFLAIA